NAFGAVPLNGKMWVMGGGTNDVWSSQVATQLGIAQSGQQTILFWPACATNVVLQTTTNLPSPNWIAVTNDIPITGVTVTNNLPAAFFRLVQTN
ncbi:MAG: hypothetical protein ABSF34_17360, partial [Verrucomicrobiota bacterium]